MTRLALSFCGAAAMFAFAPSTSIAGAEAQIQAPQPPIYVRLDATPKEKIQGCPIRFELPIAAVLSGKEKVYRTGRPTNLECDGARVAMVQMELDGKPGAPRGSLGVKAYIWLPEGVDQDISIRYAVVQEDHELGNGDQEMSGDEGEHNWSSVLYIGFVGLDPSKPAYLRAEVSMVPR